MQFIMKYLSWLVFTITFIAAFSSCNNASAQPPPPPPPPCFPPPCVPIDGGISFLLVAGAIYGGKKIYELSKKG